jgi:glycosyltransferase involved in cell wall biosynthesis
MRWLASPFFYIWSAIAIWRHARKAHLSLLHAQNKYGLPGAWLASRALGVPCLVTLRDTLSICTMGRCLMTYEQVPAGCGRGHLWKQCQQEHIEVYIRPRSMLARLKAQLATRSLQFDTWVRSWFLKHADGIVAVSQGILSLYEQAGLVQGRAAQVIYNLPPLPDHVTLRSSREILERYQLGEGPIVLYVGKFSPGKGSADLARAAHRLQESYPAAQFVFVGGSAADLGVEGPNIRVLGRIPNQDVLQLQAAATLVVVPSVWPEPLSRVLLEAMAMGRAVIGTRVGGTPEIIEDGRNGLLVPRSAPEQLAEAISQLLQNPNLRQQMEHEGQRVLQSRFNREKSIAQMVAFYAMLQTKP